MFLNRFIRTALAISVAVTATGCELIEYHPYDTRTDYHDLNAKATRHIEELCSGRDSITFVWMGDTQLRTDETRDMVRSINARGDIDFVLHGGDLTEFGTAREFEWMHDELRGLRMPYAAIIGNHDVLGSGMETFRSMYGPLDFSFMAGNTLFVCLNTNALEFDYTVPVPNFDFLIDRIENSSGHDKVVVAMHTAPYQDQFNDNLAMIFHQTIKRFDGLAFCLNAHYHKLTADDIFGDGIIYYGCDTVKNRSYMVFHITPEGYDYEVVRF